MVLNKPTEELIALKNKINYLLSNQSFTIDHNFWEEMLSRIRVRESETILLFYYQEFKEWYSDLKEVEIEDDERWDEPTSPILSSAVGINPKLITTEEEERSLRIKMNERIFKAEF